MTQPSSRIQTDAFWQAHIDRWRASALTQWAYCKQEDLSYAKFIRERRKVQTNTPPQKKRFIAVTVREDKMEQKAIARESGGMHHVEIFLSSGHTIRLSERMPIQAMASLIRLLGDAHA